MSWSSKGFTENKQTLYRNVIVDHFPLLSKNFINLRWITMMLPDFFVGDTIMLVFSSIVYESKSISLNNYTDLQLPNLFQHISGLAPAMQNSFPCDRFASYRISLNIGSWLIETSSSKQNTSFNLMACESSRTTGCFRITTVEGCTCLIVSACRRESGHFGLHFGPWQRCHKLKRYL